MNARQQRYHQKRDFILEKLSSLPARPRTAVEVDAILYRIQVAIEAAVDIVAMLVKDKGYSVGDDYHNIGKLVDLKVIPSVLGERFKQLNGLRNAIVHKYNRFEEETVLTQLPIITKTLTSFLKIVDYELKTLLGKGTK